MLQHANFSNSYAVSFSNTLYRQANARELKQVNKRFSQPAVHISLSLTCIHSSVIMVFYCCAPHCKPSGVDENVSMLLNIFLSKYQMYA